MDKENAALFSNICRLREEYRTALERIAQLEATLKGSRAVRVYLHNEQLKERVKALEDGWQKFTDDLKSPVTSLLSVESQNRLNAIKSAYGPYTK